MFLATGKPLDKNFIELGGFKIAWYAVMIFGGAFLAYFISKYIHLTTLGKLYHVFLLLPLIVACIFLLIMFMI